MPNSIQRINWLDSLRALAIIAVIIIHVASPAVNMAYGKNMFDWWVGNVFNSATRFAVPLFLMISGAVLFSNEYKIGTFFKKRFFRVLLPLLFWMLAYWVFRYFTLLGNPPTGFSNITNWGIKLFLNEGISKHLWFVYMMLFLYILTPFVGAFVRKLKPTMIVFLLAAWVLVCSISKDFAVNMYSWSGNLFPKFINYFTYLGYMVLGYYLYKIFYVSRNIRLSAWILYIITILIAAGMTFYSSQTKGKLDLSIYNYLSLNTIIQSFAIFVALKDTSLKQNILVKVRDWTSDYSFGIYLVHIIVIGIFFRNGIFWTMANPLISIPVVVILTFITSFLIIFILRKIPLGKYISG